MIVDELEIEDDLGVIVYSSIEGIKLLLVDKNEEITLSGQIYIKGNNFILEKEEIFYPNFDDEGKLKNVEKSYIINMKVK